MDNKMTDGEIKNALECCASSTGAEACKGCPFAEKDICDKEDDAPQKYALALINRQQVEIERLQKILDTRCDKCPATATAITEFAERVKDIFSPEDEVRQDIDDLVQEMEGDEMHEMTCKDCLSEFSCSLILKQIYQNKAEECPYFKNKAAPVGVVQCKNCEFVLFNSDNCTYHCKRRGYFSEKVEATDFCSNGKEKTTR